MASTFKSLSLVARASAYRLPSGVRRARRTVGVHPAIQIRPFAITPRRFADDDNSSRSGSDAEIPGDDVFEKILEDMAAAGHPMPESEVETYQSIRRLAHAEGARPDKIYGSLQRDMESGATVREIPGVPQSLVDEEELVQIEPKPTQGFFAEDEGAEDPDEDEEFEPDDISSNAHLELEQMRELREFARVMAWDMPLLYNHRKAFTAPTKDQPLRFRYTTYLGEDHPATKKVVLEFSPSALPNLTPVQKAKLIKLLGTRYNPQTDNVRMSSEHHPTSAQNKRHLATTLDALLKECREGKDTFEDVPFDFRHHKDKIIHKFPEEWKITDERKQYLAEARAKRLEADQAHALGDGQVDGRRVIESMLSSSLAQSGTQQPQKEAVRIPAGRGAQAKGPRQRS